VAASPTALTDEHKRFGVAGTAESNVVDEALSGLMPQIHPPRLRSRRTFFSYRRAAVEEDPPTGRRRRPRVGVSEAPLRDPPRILSGRLDCPTRKTKNPAVRRVLVESDL